MTRALVLQGLAVDGPNGRLFPPLDLTAEPGQVTTVMGPSGVGKSALLAAIGGLLPDGLRASGRVLMAGRDITESPAERRRIGIVFQDAVLFPHLSLGDNLSFGLSAEVRGRAARRARVAEALVNAGMGGMQDRDPATLSGGQRIRAAVMRTLLSDPLALLLDEPFSALDADRRAEMRAFVFDHVRAAGLPTLLVSHDSADAAAAGGPVLHLSASRAGPER